ncbi:hypothetical protein GJAV_G00118780 [Gymnothorax javanicus]|nr:hypothetical protein GJAV_G00118780 [Gymnothorax javanicus]
MDKDVPAFLGCSSVDKKRQPQPEINDVCLQKEVGQHCFRAVYNLHTRKKILACWKLLASVEMSTGEGCGQTGPRAKTHIDSETSQSKKRDRKKPKKARVRGRKQKLKSSECASSLLQELPFANTIVWKDLGFETSEKAVKKKRKRGDSGRGESEEDGDKKKKRQPRPNYFVSIPITNPKIRDGIQAVQDLLVEKDKRYSKALIPVGSLHITLLVTYLSNEEEVDVARGVMAQMEQTVRDLLQGKDLVLPFLGIGNFRNEVAFVQLAEGVHVTVLTEIAEVVRKMFEEKGVSSRDGRAFKPHLTFVKLSKAPKLRSQGLKKIDPEAYESFLEHSFGEETVSRLDLCSMLKKKTPDGYFHCETSITFGSVEPVLAQPLLDSAARLSPPVEGKGRVGLRRGEVRGAEQPFRVRRHGAVVLLSLLTSGGEDHWDQEAPAAPNNGSEISESRRRGRRRGCLYCPGARPEGIKWGKGRAGVRTQANVEHGVPNLIQGTPRAARTSEKKGAEPDDEELLSLSKRLVEDAVLRAVQQYMEETQRNADTPGDQGSAKPGQNLNASGSK